MPHTSALRSVNEDYRVQDEMIVIDVELGSRLLRRIDMIQATGFNLHIIQGAMADMPRGTPGFQGEVVFFKLKIQMTADEVNEMCASRNLVLADGDTHARANQTRPHFAETHPNLTLWQHKNGQWCYMSFQRDGSETAVHVEALSMNPRHASLSAGSWIACLRI